jgi:methionyl-tRNA formyltransferase
MFKNITKENGVTLASCVLMLVFWLFLTGRATAQTGNHVPAGGEMANHGTVSLQTSTLWSTARTTPQGYFSAVGTASYTGADDAHNINGYVKHYVTAANQGFTFPVGTGADLRTLTTSGTIASGVNIATAWIAGNPGTVTDPTDNATHSVTALGTGITAVSTAGQWDWVGSAAGATVTVSIPDLSSFGDAVDLRLVGWNGTQWVSLGTAGASANTEDGSLSGTMIAGITAIGVGKAIEPEIPCATIATPGVVTPSKAISNPGESVSFTLAGNETVDQVSWEIYPTAGVSPNSGTGSSTGNVTFTIAGEYNVIFTLVKSGSPTGCNVPTITTASNTHIVKPLPTSCTPPSPGSITVTPTSAAIQKGGTASFSMSGGTPNSGIQWRVSPITGVTPAAGTGASTGNITFNNAGVYTIIYSVINEGALDCDPIQMSATATIAVGTNPCNPPSTLLVIPTSDLSTAKVGDNVSFAANGGTPGAITWQVTPATAVSPSSGTGATTANLTLLEGGMLTITFTSTNSSSPAGCTVPATVSRSRTFFVLGSPSITSPTPPVVGQPATLTATGCESGSTVQWYNNGTAIAGATSSTYTVNPVVAGAVYTAKCVKDGTESAPSNEIKVQPAAPVVTPSPNPPVVGQPLTLTTSCPNGGTIKWYKNGTVIAGATTSPLVIPAASVAAGDVYTATCTNNGEEGEPSNEVPVKPTAPVVTTPTPAVVGQPTTMTATGCTTGTINWYNNGTLLPQYAGQNPLTVTPAAGDNYTSTCTVNGVPSDPSNPITPGTKPTPPTVTPTPNPPVVGQPTTLTVTGCTGTISWFNNGTALPQYAGQNPITVTPAAGDNYTATCTVGGIPSDPSNPVIPGTKPTAPVVTTPTPPVVGQPTTMTATGCTTGTINWYNNGTLLPQYAGQNPLTVTPAAGDSYTSTCTVAGIPSDPSNPVTPGTKPTPPTVTPNPTPPVVGQPTTLTVTGCTGTISWFNNGTALPQYAGQNPITVTPAAGDNYTATCTVDGIPSDPSNPVTPGTKPTAPVITTPTPAVVGQPTTMTATGCTTGTINWYNKGTLLPQYAGQNSITVTPVAGDVYTSTCTVGGIPSDPSNPVTPGTKPTPPTVTPNPNPPVVGQPTTLTVTGCTGTISWFNNGTALPQYAGQNPITVTPAAGDSYTSTCTVGGIPSDPSNPITPGTKPTPPTVTPNPNPPVVGQPTTLTVTGCTGTISWFNNGTALPQYAGQNPITVTPAAGDNYTSTCTVAGIPSDPSNPITPGTKPTAPVVTTPTPPVVGQPTTMTATGCTTGTINWFNNGTALPQYAGQNPITVTPAAGDNYTSTCTVAGIPSDPSNTITPGTKPTAPVVTTPTPPVVGQPTTMTATGCTTGTINWFNNGTALPQYAGQNPITVTPAAGDNYTATCTVAGIPSDPSNPITPGEAIQDYNTTIQVLNPGNYAVGVSKSYTVSYTNTLSSPATKTEEAMITVPFGWTCTGCGSVTIPALGVGQTHSVNVTLTATAAGAAGSLTSNITNGSGGDTRSDNNKAAVNVRTAN